jgi:hypothetical protein
MSMMQCKLNLKTLSNYVVVASSSCGFRIALEPQRAIGLQDLQDHRSSA